MPIQSISGPFVGPAGQRSIAERMATRLYQYKATTEANENPSTRAAATNTATDGPQPVSLVCISDTHNTFPSHLPMGDILVHAGDLSQYGTFAEIQAQLNWISSQPHAHKIVISGNHDLLLDPNFVAAHPDRELDRHPGQRRRDLDWGDIHYLEHSSVELALEEKGRVVRIFGSPWTPKFGNFAFQYKNATQTFWWADSVPAKTDVMIVHGPPKGHVDDGGKGCEKLLAELWRAKPKVVVCGHIHAGRGEERLFFDRAQATYEQVILGKRPWLSLLTLALCVVWYKLSRMMGLSGRQAGTTHLVNAAMVGGRSNSERRDPIVITV